LSESSPGIDRAPRQTLILGTAGHIDHGKTTLIRALTGVDTDRLPEEKARGITIELGFAPLTLPSGSRLGVVDVPGHEGLVRTMVAGATGIDLVLLVVAADEGVMPQTREHLAICNLLGLREGVVALTKADLADPDVAELAEAEVQELLATTSLAGAPVFRVSATSGEGVDGVREALDAAASRAATRTPRSGPARLWIDRCFESRGFGNVVTGTLIGGPLVTGQEVTVHPAGEPARVRGLQSFGEPVERVEPGARCAVNLQGIDRSQLDRGMLVCAPDALAPTELLDAWIVWLPEAPELGDQPSSLELLVGTTQRRARVAPIGEPRITPGEGAFVRIHLDDGPAPLLPGDGFVLRGFAKLAGGGATLGGGRVLDVAPPRRRRADPALLAELETLREGTPLEGLVVRIARTGFAGIPQDRLVRECGLAREELAGSIERAIESDLVVRAEPLLVGTAAIRALEERALQSLSEFHEREPVRPGMPRGTLRGALPENVPRPVVDRVLARLEERGQLESSEDLVHAADFAPRLTQRQEALAANLRADAMIAGLEPKTLRDQAAELECSDEELRDILAHLERDGSLVRAPGDLWFDRIVVDELRQKVIEYLEKHGGLSTPDYKNLIGTTRKYAVPLMELFDAEHLTVRRGEERVLRRRKG
jgi:selenocysteine-specific elongation factor